MSFHPETESYKYWTIEEDFKLKSLVETSKYSFKDIGKIMNRSGQSCQDHSRALELNNKYIRRKYTFDENFWTVPNLLNCYWAGFSSADACIVKISEKSTSFLLSISRLDDNHIGQLIKDCKYSGDVRRYNRIINNDKHHYVSNLAIHSHKWGEDLKNNFNIVPNKTFRLQPPNISNNYLLMSFFCGYTDGDGTIHLDKLGRLMMGFTSASEKMINWVKEFTDINFNQKIRNKSSKCRKLSHANCWGYTISGIRAAIIIDYIRQFPISYLDRKWSQSNVLEKINEYKKEYPHFFKTLVASKIQHLLPPPQNNISHSSI